MAARKVTALLVAVATIGIAATIVAQDFQGQRREVLKPVIGGAPMQGTANSSDGQLTGWLIVDNHGEIALGKLAQQRAKDEEVKQFAERMVKDHGQFLAQLERFAGNDDGMKARGAAPGATGPATAGPGTVEGGAAPPQPGTAPQPGIADRPPAGATAQPMGSQPLNFVALKQQIGQKCLELAKSELEQKEGSQFDKCFIGAQIGEHMHVLAELEVFRNQASPELASVLDKGIETTKAHLEQAKTIAKALERTPSPANP